MKWVVQYKSATQQMLNRITKVDYIKNIKCLFVEHHNKIFRKEVLKRQTTTLNLGPTHPATHGVFQNILEIDGERIVDAEQTVGYIHRAFEKIAERRPLIPNYSTY